MDLTAEIRNYLDITWEDEQTDLKIAGIISRAEDILNGYAGEDLEYADGSEERQLLFDLVRYIYNHAYEDFKVNFADELIMIRAKYKTESLEDTEDGTAEDSNI